MATMTSPFQYGTIATGKAFVNRDKERRQLKQHLMSGINVMLISPRRWGKSSLVKEAMNELKEEENEVAICFIDAMTILSEQEFYENFSKEIIRATGNGIEAWIKSARQYLGAISPKITIGGDPMTEFSIGLDFKALKDNESDVLDLPEKIAEKKGIRIIVCIDEFQNLANLKTYSQIESRMRSAWQKQKHVSYCLYGSKRHMMMEIFTSSSKPFYRFGQIMFLDKIAPEEWISYIIRQFNDTGKSITEDLAAYIVSLAECHSWYVQQLSHFVWINTGTAADKDIIDDSFRQIINTNKPMFQSECDSLTTTQLSLLKAIADGVTGLTGTKAMQDYAMGTPQNIIKNKKVLTNKDLISAEGANLVFVDPIFRHWFVETY